MAATILAALALASLAVSVQGDVPFDVVFVVPASRSACQLVNLSSQLYHVDTVTMIYFCAGCDSQTVLPFDITLKGNYEGQDAVLGTSANATVSTTYATYPTLPYPQQNDTEMGVCVTLRPGYPTVSITLQLRASPADAPLPCGEVVGIAGARSLCTQRDGEIAVPTCGLKKYGCQDGCVGSFNPPLPAQTVVFNAHNVVVPDAPLSPGDNLFMSRLYTLTQLTVTARCTTVGPGYTHHVQYHINRDFQGSEFVTRPIAVADGATVTVPLSHASPFPQLGAASVLMSIGLLSPATNCTVILNTSVVGTTAEMPST
ncbi:hypothetical protein DIPPA_33600 [Diplonema papillatum]|nr:hypothetical protein DIPPA_33600 [Diplonema papillatum]|eukprot:gene18658-28803_t